MNLRPALPFVPMLAFAAFFVALQLFFELAQCYCSEPVCGGATGPCATVCDPEPDPDVSQDCIDCVVDSLSGACETQAQACSTDT